VSVVSSRRLPLVFRASVVFFFIRFVVAVLSKVAGAPTALACELSAVSSFHWGGGTGSPRKSWPSFARPWRAFWLLFRLPPDRGPR
jgi:hypothetical protein